MQERKASWGSQIINGFISVSQQAFRVRIRLMRFVVALISEVLKLKEWVKL